MAEKEGFVNNFDANNLLGNEKVTSKVVKQHPFSKLLNTFLIATLIGSLTINCSYQNQKWELEVSYKAALRQIADQFNR